ncbi:hypothetical protein ACIO14_06905 [Nocardia fluminea]|uniref:hypothetical protein n=1 Tax=Nocardia fluminea TaxID=134984 RepID=UPI00380BADDC
MAGQREPGRLTRSHPPAGVAFLGCATAPVLPDPLGGQRRGEPDGAEATRPGAGIEFIRSPAGAEQTRISVHSFGTRAAAGDIVRVAVRLGAERSELLVVLYADDDGTITGQVVTRALTMSEDLEISLLPGAALGSTHTSAVTDAVRCSSTAGRNAWRRVAKGLPAGDPVRAAIVAGLS